MIARELELDCSRCKGRGRVTTKRLEQLCSCPAGRALASCAMMPPVFASSTVRHG